MRDAIEPLAGAAIGLCGYGLMLAIPGSPGAVAALAFWTVMTLARGERGFAHWLPALPMLGTLLGFCTVLLRWYALMALAGQPERIVAAMTLGPAASIALAWISRPVDPAAFRRLSVLSTPVALMAILQGAIASLLCGMRLGFILIAASYLLVRMVSAFLKRCFGGVRASDLQAFRVSVETVALLIASI
jgi:hypothetical protein